MHVEEVGAKAARSGELHEADDLLLAPPPEWVELHAKERLRTAGPRVLPPRVPDVGVGVIVVG